MLKRFCGFVLTALVMMTVTTLLGAEDPKSDPAKTPEKKEAPTKPKRVGVPAGQVTGTVTSVGTMSITLKVKQIEQQVVRQQVRVPATRPGQRPTTRTVQTLQPKVVEKDVTVLVHEEVIVTEAGARRDAENLGLKAISKGDEILINLSKVTLKEDGKSHVETMATAITIPKSHNPAAEDEKKKKK